MNDAGLNSLLKWGIRNSDTSETNVSGTEDGAVAVENGNQDPSRGLDKEALSRLLGGPSDADRMKDAMATIHSPEIDIEQKKVAFDNFEQLIENLDNANNMETLGLWMPLVDLLNPVTDGSDEQKNNTDTLNFWAAWCIGTAVQNNARAQERLLVLGGIGKLLHLVANGASKDTRKKAARALSSEVRNYQPALDEMVEKMPITSRPKQNVDAGEMDMVDSVIDVLRQSAERGGWT